MELLDPWDRFTMSLKEVRRDIDQLAKAFILIGNNTVGHRLQTLGQELDFAEKEYIKERDTYVP